MAKPLTLGEARALMLARSRGAPQVEQVTLADAHGRSLAADVHAAGPWPATDRSAMDGFAVLVGAAGLAAGTSLPVVGESLAGKPFAGALAAGRAIRIMTGAVVPPGADAVVPVEQTSGFAGSSVTLSSAVSAGQNIRPEGSEVRAGQRVLSSGQLLRAAEIGALAVLGHTKVAVARQPIVAIVATGDEIVPIEQSPLPHQVRESNSWALAAQVRESGGVPLRLGIAPDEPVALRTMLEVGLQRADVLLTIGGISKGTHDLVHSTLGELGVRTEFHGIDLKPGKPTYFGTVAGRTARFVVGLPGNPASSFTVFDLLVRPLLLQLLGRDPGEQRGAAIVGGAPWRANSRLQAVPARLAPSPGGELVAELLPPSPSGDPFGLLLADGYALVPSLRRHGEQPTVPIAGSSAGVHLP